MNEAVGRLLVAAINAVRGNQLRIGAKRWPGIDVAETERAAKLRRDIPFLCITERPNLVALHALARKVPHDGIVVCLARRSDFGEQLDNGSFGSAGHTARSA